MSRRILSPLTPRSSSNRRRSRSPSPSSPSSNRRRSRSPSPSSSSHSPSRRRSPKRIKVNVNVKPRKVSKPTNTELLYIGMGLINVVNQSDLPEWAFSDAYRNKVEVIRWVINDDTRMNLSKGMFKPFTRLSELAIEGKNITHLPDGLFEGLNLRLLSIQRTRIETLPLDIFKGLSRLHSLTLSNNQIHILPSGMFDSLRNLQLFHMSHNLLTNLEDDTIFENTRLENVDLSSNKIRRFNPSILVNTKSVKMHASLADNELSGDYVHLLRAFQEQYDDFFISLNNQHPPPQYVARTAPAA